MQFKHYTFFLIIIVALFISCSSNPGFRKHKAAFDSSAVLTKYKAIGDMNDAFFTIRQNNYFEFYMQLFDSVKNSSYPGKFIRSGDTLLLNFYNKKGETLLGSKAFINPNKREIIFFDNKLGVKRTLVF